ncbi:MAG: hypothetical protein KF864_02795 [Phycisphaeraceae bacterium]|nr:hypothetical protein [Phycisphaeraceae bacterium]
MKLARAIQEPETFGRVTRSGWERLGGAFYTDFRVAYDRNGGVLSETDELVRRKVTGGSWNAGDYYFSRLFTNDGLGRLTEAVEGHISGGAIASGKRTRREEWELSPTGNWLTQKLDLNGDGSFGGSGERNWAGTFNKANEFTARGGNSPAYDVAGNMTDDGVNYTYVHDAFGRLTAVKTRGGSPATVSEYRYNGLGHRIGWRSDTNFDSTVDGSDPWYWFVYDDRWRVVATYRGSDAHPKERFIHHNAGPAGFGGSSYIDSVILRDSDDPEGWTNAADGTLETRHYYLQNWRHDVVALIEPDGTPFEYIRYSAYGVPSVYAAGDVNRDGVCDGFDPQDWDDYNDYGTGAMAVDLDVNRDGVVDSADRALVQGHADWLLWTNHGRGSVSRLHNRRGYAGYEYDPATSQWHVRHRVLVSEMGRWNRRDPLGYVDGMSLYEYVGSRAVVAVDPSGLRRGSHCTGDWGAHFHMWPDDSPPVCKAIPDPISPPPPPPTDPFPKLVVDDCPGGTIPDWAWTDSLYQHIRETQDLCRGKCTRIKLRCVTEQDTAWSSGCQIGVGPPSTPGRNRWRYTLHELRHVQQYCIAGDIASCEDRMCRELDAYMKADQCGRAMPPTSPASCCDRACDSVVADTKTRCFGSHANCVTACAAAWNQGTCKKYKYWQ